MTDTEPGVWIVADTHWGTEGPGLALPFPDELSALRAANDAGWQQRAWFVPHGVDLRDVMNGDWKPQSPNATQKCMSDILATLLVAHAPDWGTRECLCGAPFGPTGPLWAEHAASQIAAAIQEENRNA